MRRQRACSISISISAKHKEEEKESDSLAPQEIARREVRTKQLLPFDASLAKPIPTSQRLLNSSQK